MRRRQFITLLGVSAATASALVARAQQTAMPVIGFLNGTTPTLVYTDRVRSFLQGLGEAGYFEGQNVAIEYRWGENQYDRLPALAADLVRRQVSVIAATGGAPEALAAKAATKTIQIVFQTGVDPVAIGLVASLARPGGNVTGVTQLSVELAPKLVELVHELVPAASVIALMVNPTNPGAELHSRNFQLAARTFGLQIDVMHASTESDFESIFETLTRRQVGALVIGADSFLSSRNELLAALALRHLLPAIYAFRNFPAVGGLMSYGGSIADAQRLAGIYTGRILKGERPANLPVQQSTKIELVINLKTAKALGLDLPAPLLGRADEVIE